MDLDLLQQRCHELLALRTCYFADDFNGDRLVCIAIDTQPDTSDSCFRPLAARENLRANECSPPMASLANDLKQVVAHARQGIALRQHLRQKAYFKVGWKHVKCWNLFYFMLDKVLFVFKSTEGPQLL